jgi:DNA-binding HxlR family transcriptional regulator
MRYETRATGNSLPLLQRICYNLYIMTKPIEPRAGCIECAMKIIGSKWTALILRDMAHGEQRYSDLQQNISINPRTLAQRLDTLITENIVYQTESRGYALTDKGRDLIPILERMASWGDKYTRPTLA